ncbi:MAG: hypothetical protein JXA39_01330, partial [Bacteroidales bacterium]|nr:hypothetical protein [Bacteroidales bacterium]
KLKKGVDATELEEMILKEFIPAYEENFAGIKLFLLKSDRGTNQGEYSILLVFDSIDERNEWWPAQDQSSDKAEEAAGRMAEMYEKLQSMIEMGTGNDWLVIK